jgi:hypothetical protein
LYAKFWGYKEWSNGVLEKDMEYWSNGNIKQWSDGVMGNWSTGVMEYWVPNRLDFEILLPFWFPLLHYSNFFFQYSIIPILQYSITRTFI